MPLWVSQTVDAGALEEYGRLLAEGFLFVRQLRQIDGNWSDLATGHREVGRILVLRKCRGEYFLSHAGYTVAELAQGISARAL
jgi:hypothetical protein